MKFYVPIACALLSLSACLSATAQPNVAPMVAKDEVKGEDRIETWTGKKIMIFTPHPDDEMFGMGGTLIKLAKNGNDITIVIFTNDDKGSKDTEMTSERLARIRRAEEEKSCALMGIPKEKLIWLGYEDGNLEYADPQVLRGQLARLMKIHRPDVVFSPDPGTKYVEWHKTDHRMAANITKDAFIACEWHLYYPQHLLDEGLQCLSIPIAYYYYSQEPNYEVDISAEMDTKLEAAIAHTSQWEPSTSKYTDTLPEDVKQQIREEMTKEQKAGGKKPVERFRRELLP